MFHHPVPRAVLQLLQFLSTHREAFFCAARLLGGPPALRDVSKLFEALSVPEPRITRSIARNLVALHALLSDASIGAPPDPDHDHVLLIEPDDATVAEISLLAAGFGDHLDALAADGLLNCADHT